MKIMKEDMRNAEARIRNFIKTQAKLPRTANIGDMKTGKPVNLGIEEYCGLFFNEYTFFIRNGRFPDFTSLVVKKATPTVLNFQDTKYNCGPATLSMCSSKLFNIKSENELSRVLKTDKNGTNPYNLLVESRKAGLIVTRIQRNPGAVKKALDAYKAVICHYQTGAAACAGFMMNYGHYAMIYSLRNGEYTIYDPTRGVFKCETSMMDKATQGRSICYYSVENV